MSDMWVATETKIFIASITFVIMVLQFQQQRVVLLRGSLQRSKEIIADWSTEPLASVSNSFNNLKIFAVLKTFNQMLGRRKILLEAQTVEQNPENFQATPVKPLLEKKKTRKERKKKNVLKPLHNIENTFFQVIRNKWQFILFVIIQILISFITWRKIWKQGRQFLGYNTFSV